MGRLAGAELGEVTLPNLLPTLGSRSHQLALVAAGTMGTLCPFLQSAVGGIAARVLTFLQRQQKGKSQSPAGGALATSIPRPAWRALLPVP